jgi:phage terminase large subunit-like protein
MRLVMLEIVTFLRPRLSLSQVVLVFSIVTVGVIAAEGIGWLNHRSFTLLAIVFDPLLKGVLC